MNGSPRGPRAGPADRPPPAALDGLTDVELIHRVADRDQAAFELLYRRHRAGMLAFGFRMLGDWHAAEEVTQDTFVTLWRQAAGFQHRSTVRVWLYGVARNHALNRRRRRVPPVRDVSEVVDVASMEDGPEDRALAAAGEAELSSMLSHLDPAHREILTLTFVAGLSAAEVAGVLGVAVGTVKSRLHRAKRQLAVHLTRASTEALT